jgi:hypothetical protein
MLSSKEQRNVVLEIWKSETYIGRAANQENLRVMESVTKKISIRSVH